MTLLALLFTTALANPIEAALTGDEAAIAELRDQGPAGLRAVLQASTDDPRYQVLADKVAQQRDASHSGLYWYTDMDEAKRAAQEAGKPIVSLRLLGELTSEFSCANSRLFRTVLYSNPDVASWLDEHVILHWSSERPAPVARIDFGDGRVMTRTITGNSAHIVLDSYGRPLDVIPGLYEPTSFIAELSSAETLFASIEAKPKRRTALVERWHQNQLQATTATVAATLRQTRGELDLDTAQELMIADPMTSVEVVPAIIPMEMTATKSKMEAPVLDQLDLGGALVPIATLDAGVLPPISELEWDVLSAPYTREIHEATVVVITRENPTANLPVMLRQLQEDIAADTAHNEAELHARVHSRLSEAPYTTFDTLTTWLYADLFKTPKSDPWLGMLDPNAYTGLTNGGLSE